MIVLYETFDEDILDNVVGVAGALFLLAYPVRKLVDWLTSHFVVTSDRIIHRRGFIAKYSMEVPLEAINDVRFEQGVIDRIIGAGTLVVQSASEAGRQVFDHIRKPEEVQKTIYHQGELNQQRMMRGAAAGLPLVDVGARAAGRPPRSRRPHGRGVPGAEAQAPRLTCRRKGPSGPSITSTTGPATWTVRWPSTRPCSVCRCALEPATNGRSSRRRGPARAPRHRGALDAAERDGRVPRR